MILKGKQLRQVIREEIEDVLKEDDITNIIPKVPDYKGYDMSKSGGKIDQYLFTVPNNADGIDRIRKVKEALRGFYTFRLRGRHHDRKSVLGDKYRPGSENDIPLKQAEYIAVYVYAKN